MKKKYKRWSDKDVEKWGKIYILPFSTLMGMENLGNGSHSTIWWGLTHRLPKINKRLSKRVTKKLKGELYRFGSTQEGNENG